MAKKHLRWRYIIKWNETKYNADNTTGWEATKSNDESETPQNNLIGMHQH